MTQSSNNPQISTPEQLEGLVGPGQENILEEFVQEQEAAQSNDKILGKFNTQEDLAKAGSKEINSTTKELINNF